ncbi:MAG: 2-hydroxyacyl-CoA dehydratase subunit D [Anaerovoracaceae bacterium]|jgi:benzoyl-CoA reductase/2-hydroxyglutaryl-CoA dehydratase subunit BcrC/BadD/HgdB
MNKLVERFGKVVDSNIEKRPGLARKLLQAGFAYADFNFNHRPNKKLPPSKQYAAAVCMKALREPLRDPANSAIVNLFLPCEMLHIAGIRPLVAEQVSCYVAGAASEQGVLRKAEEAGVPPTMCSYHRILSGSAFAGIIGKPMFTANTTMVCDANISTFRFLADHFGVPHFTVDTPVSSSLDAVMYVADQLRELKGMIEDVSGRRISDEELRKRVQLSERSLAAYREYIRSLAGKYMATDLTSEMYTILLSHNMLGTGQAAAYFEKLVRDVKAAPAYRGGNRIFWIHTIPNCQNSMCDIFNYSEQNQMLICDLTTDFLDAGTADDPYISMARRLQECSFNGRFEVRAERALKTAKELNANGIVMFTHWGCRHTCGGARIMEDMAGEAGIPMLILDGDGCDLSNINEGQMITRVQAFLEMLEDKR